MTSSRAALSCLLVGFYLSTTLGCSTIWHEIQPHRMMKWNNGPAPSLDPEFSFNEHHEHSKTANLDRGQALNVLRAQSPDHE